MCVAYMVISKSELKRGLEGTRLRWLNIVKLKSRDNYCESVELIILIDDVPPHGGLM